MCVCASIYIYIYTLMHSRVEHINRGNICRGGTSYRHAIYTSYIYA